MMMQPVTAWGDDAPISLPALVVFGSGGFRDSASSTEFLFSTDRLPWPSARWRFLARDLRRGAGRLRKAPDPAFAWKQTSNHTTPAGTVHSIELTSQVWQGITWKHALTIYEPAELTYTDTVLLFIVGGSTGSRPDEGDHKLAFALTKTTGARVAVLHQVPNQPLLGNRKEDDLISETFVRYLETKDKNWPLLFPMVKSAVRAMDAVQAWAKEKGKGEVTRFVVTGGSKRGWTTWLTGAADHRVIAIAPMVIVMLNMGLQGPNQLAVWGNYSEQIDDYVKRGPMERAKTRKGGNSGRWSIPTPSGNG